MDSSEDEVRTSKFASERSELCQPSSHKLKPGKAEREQRRQARLDLDLEALGRISTLDTQAENFHVMAAKALREPQIHLVKSVVTHIGAEACLGLLEKTRDVHRSGGVKAGNGQGIKSPGGVFFSLVKDTVSPELKRLIFQSDKQGKKQAKREKRRFDLTEERDFQLSKPTLSFFPQLNP